eukprot:GHVU01030305.1.p1 GENE.GHVU01030305.1~~GHVU01030305.1.p1  ORF type:complete len:150 (-),score=15.45 GHVU01030305.1:2-451(-)
MAIGEKKAGEPCEAYMHTCIHAFFFPHFSLLLRSFTECCRHVLSCLRSLTHAHTHTHTYTHTQEFVLPTKLPAAGWMYIVLWATAVLVGISLGLQIHLFLSDPGFRPAKPRGGSDIEVRRRRRRRKGRNQLGYVGTWVGEGSWFTNACL